MTFVIKEMFVFHTIPQGSFLLSGSDLFETDWNVLADMVGRKGNLSIERMSLQMVSARQHSARVTGVFGL